MGVGPGGMAVRDRQQCDHAAVVPLGDIVVIVTILAVLSVAMGS